MSCSTRAAIAFTTATDHTTVQFMKKNKKNLVISKKIVPLHAFSAFRLQSSAAEGTDDTHFGYANVEDSASRLTDVNH